MIYCFDIDGTICTTQEDHDYTKAEPFTDVVEEINRLYNSGHTIRLATARGNGSGIDWAEFTKEQIEGWGVSYHSLCVGKKLGADVYVDDKAVHISDFRKKINRKTGIVAGSFDIIHAGYVYMFEDAKKHCNYLIVALHEDPSLERPQKIKPNQSVEDRSLILSSIKHVDEVVTYQTEGDFEDLLVSLAPDVRILGSDYKNKGFTGDGLDIPIHFHNRNHEKSSSLLKKDIARSVGLQA